MLHFAHDFSVISARIAVLFCAVILLFEVKESPAAVKPDTSTSLGLVDVATGMPLGADVTKVIVLVHGYQPTLSADAYSEVDWKALKDALVPALENTDWHLAVYHWERQAATGSAVHLLQHATEASEIAEKLGASIGVVLSNLPRLEAVQLISHSAGAWAVHSAAKYLLGHTTRPVIQVTLLDPFIPNGAVEQQGGILGTIDNYIEYLKRGAPLKKQAMDDLAKAPGSRLVKLENYYTRDLAMDPSAQVDKVTNPEIGASLQGQKPVIQLAPPAPTGVTAVEFNWRNGDTQMDLSKSVDFISPGNVAGSTVSSIVNVKTPMPLISHGTAIAIYAQSVRGEGQLATPNQTPPVGWSSSLFKTHKFNKDHYKMIIGKWQGTRHLVEYRSDGTYIIEGTDIRAPYHWRIEGDILIIDGNHNQIVQLTEKDLVLKDPKSGIVCPSTRYK